MRFPLTSLLTLGYVGTSFAVLFLLLMAFPETCFPNRPRHRQRKVFEDTHSQTSLQSILLEAPRLIWQLSFTANHFPLLLCSLSTSFPRW